MNLEASVDMVQGAGLGRIVKDCCPLHQAVRSNSC